MTYVGIDPSLAQTAIAIIDDDGTMRTRAFPTAPAAGPTATVLRMNRIERQVRTVLEGLGAVDLAIAIEGPAYGRADGKSHERAGLWWRLYTRASLYCATEPLVVPPTALKKYATGKGTADKDKVLLAVARRYPDAHVGTNDEADALVLAAMVARLDGHAVETHLPVANLAALRSFTPDEP